MQNLWIVKIECVSGRYLEETCAKICEIQSGYELEDLHYFILHNFKFDNDHLHNFFISRRHRGSDQTFLEDESITLDRIFPLKKKHFLFFYFDYGDDWIFKITRMRKKVVFSEGVLYPRVIEQIGKDPEQYLAHEEYYEEDV